MEIILYVVEHAPAGDILRTYQGMSAETVSRLIAEGGNSFDFITAEDYAAREAAAPKPELL